MMWLTVTLILLGLIGFVLLLRSRLHHSTFFSRSSNSRPIQIEPDTATPDQKSHGDEASEPGLALPSSESTPNSPNKYDQDFIDLDPSIDIIQVQDRPYQHESIDSLKEIALSAWP